MKITMRLSDGTVVEALPASKKDVKKFYRAVAAGGLITLIRDDGEEVIVNGHHIVYMQETA